MQENYGIIILKPDGVTKGLMKECESEFLKRNIKILSKKFVRLSKQDIEKYFYYQIAEYIDYMCEKEVYTYFLVSSSVDLDEELFIIKNDIRRKNGVSGSDLKNFIHGAHCGTEFFFQRKLLFPEYETYAYSAGFDMYCKLPKIDSNIVRKIKLIKDTGKLAGIIFDIEKNMRNEFAELLEENNWCNFISYCITETFFLNEIKCEIIHYYTRNCENKCVDFLGIIDGLRFNLKSQTTLEGYNRENMNYLERKIDDIILALANMNIFIKGILINTPEMTLQEAECRYEYARERRYLISAGSFNVRNLGLFGISQKKAMDVLKIINGDDERVYE